MAEQAMLAGQTREETLHLLAVIARGTGADIRDYRTPAERWEESYTPRPAVRASARAERIAFAQQAGGDLG